jgi:hypothetical protein
MGKEGASALVKAMDRRDELKGFICWNLRGEPGAPLLVPNVEPLLDDPATRECAVHFLVQADSRNRALHKALARSLASESPKEKDWAVKYLAECGPEGAAAIPFIKLRLLNHDANARASALVGLARLDPKGSLVLSSILDTLSEREPGIRREAVRALGQLGSAARPALPRWRKP